MEIGKLIKSLDNNKDIVSQTNDGLLIWPVIRYIVIQHLIDKGNNLNSASSKLKLSKFEIVKKIFWGLINNPFIAPRKSILIFSSSSSYVKSENNSYFNRITDYLLEFDKENSLKIDEDFDIKNKRKYPSYSKFILSLYIEILTRLILLISPKKATRQRTKINYIIEAINLSIQDFQLKIEDPNIKAALFNAIIRMEYTYKVYIKLYEIKNIKKIIIEDGYYGLDKAIIIKAASDKNIIVYEPQHGFINENHPSYNYGALILNNINFKEYYPDFFLSYGEFWSNSVNLPNKIINIGNPHLEQSHKKVINVRQEKKVLVIGSGVTIKETNDLLLKLVDTLQEGYELYYRPHPQESNDFLSRYKAAFMNGVLLDNEELYNSLARSEIIIGELTTVIFESTILNNKIYLYNSSYTKAYFSERIKYINLLDFNNTSHIYVDCNSEVNYEYYWSMGWKNAFKQLMHNN
jgi:hypothetical protein